MILEHSFDIFRHVFRSVFLTELSKFPPVATSNIVVVNVDILALSAGSTTTLERLSRLLLSTIKVERILTSSSCIS